MAELNDIGAIFDCDGTLLDSMGVWRELESDLARKAGVKLSAAEKDEVNAMTIPEVCAFFHERCGLGESNDDVGVMIDGFMREYYARRAVARPGALEFVRGLFACGVPMAAASSTPGHLLRLGLESTGFAPYLRAIVSVDDVGKSKREPDVYDRARESLGTSREQTWGFEDSIYAVRTLNAAGYRTWGVYDNDVAGSIEDLERECDGVIREFTELTPERFLEASRLDLA